MVEIKDSTYVSMIM